MSTDVRLSIEQGAGRIRLDRPRALNSLTYGMVREIHAALTEWAADGAVRSVVLSGAGERGLCAGADIRALHDSAKAGGGEARGFFRDEYRLNHLISRYPKPYLAVMDGITMGGGVGISAHANLRVVTERSAVAMPETRIGLMPDVGGSRLLGRAPGEIGTHLALTAAAMTGGDALYCGFADHFVPSAALPELLAAADPVAALPEYTAEAPESPLAAQRAWIDECYAADTVEEIVARLQAAGLPEAKEAAELILAHSPTALKVTLAALRLARRHADLAETLTQEYRLSVHALTHPDLPEGIRAQVIDKDRNPRWTPATLAEVTAADVAAFFAVPAEGELELSTSR
ncbi:3-hydroxyisobutyryl-CoA hydrolase [Kitasatospora sp. MMS16-BH015]|uniref:enoyl-CoA hydratase/isomerase family protein n=1 Tax=Kitasatospora sp. MMS16-BH015 TaxID=2018025 RepID=UPI000CA3C543|nr:enoyl-CoA hydratase/isomerase family protein [Kitasatospora sp. MMS16-BH015]AUG80753.1 3-hydroxyisobutyryl-CoA hydrolase [Kitasatospora sp. MMS16-BH015]